MWIQSDYVVDGDTWGEGSGRGRLELKPVKALREALAAGADPNDHYALHEAVKRGSIGQVQALMKAGATLDMLNEDGMAPLHLAVQRREGKMVGALIKAGANVDIRVPDTVEVQDPEQHWSAIPDEPGQTPAMMAARQGNRPLLDQLRAAGASMDGVLHAAVVGEKEAAWLGAWLGPFYEREPMVKALLDEGLDPNAQCDAQFQTYRKSRPSYVSRNQGGEGNTPLHLCMDDTMADAAYGLEPAKVLLAAGADPNRGNARGDTPLHLTESDELASVLVEAGANIQQKNHDGQTPEDTVYNPAVKALFRQYRLGKLAQDSRPTTDLATPDDYMARKSRGRMM